jgi:hypothetical protein
MNHFALFVHGSQFDPDWAVKLLGSVSCQTWRKGEPKAPGCEPADPYQTSGVRVELGDGSALSYWEQERIAVEFLKAHEALLRALGASPQSEYFVVGIERRIQCTESTYGFCVGFSSELMSHALAVGAEPTAYIVLERFEGDA